MRFLLMKCLGARAVALSPPLRIRIPRPFSLPFLTTCESPLPEESSTGPSSSAAAAAADDDDDDDGDKELGGGGGGDSLSARVETLRRGESVVGAFQSWMGEGFPVHRGHVFHAINRLRKRGMNRRALEVMEWVMRERPYKLTELEYSYLLEFTVKLHGMSQAESLFLRVPREHQNQLLYNNLVMASLDRGLIKLSYGYMRKMRELAFPISPYVYNRLIVLHSSPGRRKTIPKILRQMKADGVSPHTSTYNILLKAQAKEHNVDGMSKVFDDMKGASVEPNEITYGILAIAHAVARLYTASQTYIEAVEQSRTGNNWSTLDILLILYGYHGKEKELASTWELVRELPHATSKSLLLAIEAFGRVGSISRAEEIWAELKARGKLGSTKYFNSIISAYSRHGRVEKASEVYKEMEANGCRPNAITYRHLALGCLKAGLVGEAVETMNRGKDEAAVLKVRRSTPWLETTFMLLEAFAEIGDVETSKTLFEELRESKYCRYPFVFNALLKAYVKAKVYEPELLNKMILGGARPDAETYSLVRLVERFKDDRKERRSVDAKKELGARKQR